MSQSNNRSDIPPGLQAGMFDGEELVRQNPNVPLAARMRPTSIDHVFGHEALLETGGPLSDFIQQGGKQSMILWGPPGSGKTTLASIFASSTAAHFVTLSAVINNLADLRTEISHAETRIKSGGHRTILFIDELHRFNRAQQDGLLPHVESGAITLLGATTENPSFYLVSPLLSRCRVFQLNGLNESDIADILASAIASPHGLNKTVTIAPDDLKLLASYAAGDARVGLNTLEAAASIAQNGVETATVTPVSRDDIQRAIQQPTMRYDRQGDYHFDTISAYIKSLRDSDIDSSLYWLARMLEAGEDPLFIARRMIIFASEDVGLADPLALTLAVSTQQAVHFIGMPEARLPLSETTIYLARAHKSNSAYQAYNSAKEDAYMTRHDEVPMHLRNAPTELMRELGYGVGYDNPHSRTEQNPQAPLNRPESTRHNRYYVADPNDGG